MLLKAVAGWPVPGGGGYAIFYLFVCLTFFTIKYNALNRHNVSFWDVGNVLKLDYGNGCTTL